MPIPVVHRHARLILSAAVIGLTCVGLHAQKVTTPRVPGITNFAQVESTIACGGATRPEAVAEIKKMGFASIFNLRLANERGADIAAEEAAAKAAGVRFIHIPFDTGAGDPAVADRFLAEIAKPGTEPAFIHCAGGSRAAGVWMIKRVLIDGWDLDRAEQEADALGLASRRVRQYALSYISAHTD
jgi:uncharacterized protein (TIGR01244 family)